MTPIPTTTNKFIVTNPPKRAVEKDTFTLYKNLPLPEIKEGELLLQSLFFSNDPAQRTWMQAGLKPERAYGPVVKKGDVMASGMMGKIIKSRSPAFKEGTLVTCWGGGWSQYAVVPASTVVRVPEIPGKAPELALGCLGMTGMTAWGGLFEVGKIHKDQVVVISGAAGATGSVAVQIAKNIVGCKRVIGIAGGPEKCAWVKKLGADECIDYKSPSWKKDLIAATPNFVDLYFDNVGGEILNMMFKRMARYSKIVACGAISGYNDPTNVNLNNYFEIISMRITLQGFIVFDFAKKYPEFSQKLAQAVIEGKIATEDSATIVEAKFEDVPKVWHSLYTGANQGKLLTKLIPAKL